MTDIVERLEARASFIAVDYDNPEVAEVMFEAAAEIRRLREQCEAMMKIPDDIAEKVLEIGRAEWGQTEALDANGHASHVAESVRKTAENFGQSEPQHMHGLYIEGSETIICHTGTSPNSPQIARALTGAWNRLYEQATYRASEKG